MDPASAIGVASGVLSFVEATYKFLSTVYAVYEGDQVGGYDELASATDMVRELSQQILSDSTSTSPGPSVGCISSVANVAQQCHSLAVDLGNRLAKTKAKSRKLGDIVKAAVRTVCSKSDIERLQRALDSCRGQLHLQLTLDHSEEAKASLARLESANAALFDATERTLAKRNQRIVLASLRFGSMNERYSMVSEAADTTFDWIFDNPQKEMKSNLALVRPLKDWLDQGTGIFHVSAKPGAGKSTLMKYLWSNPQTQKKLRSWAGSQPLAMASFFFWKPGSPQQKNQDGLVRSLLYQVLTEHPDAIAELFPKHWDPTCYDPWSEPGPIQLETKEVVVAFGRLLSEPEICNQAKFCFFLDGLDEYEDERRTSQQLVTSLLKWVDLADGRLKLCVSSRELPAFQQYLPVDQRIRLHELTYADIMAVTHQTLEEHPDFQQRQGQQPQECSSLMREIVDKSDGVFLWVTLTLKLVMQSLEDGETTASIRAQVDLLPEELEDFFHFIIKSIPKHQRRKAYCSLLYVVYIFREQVGRHEGTRYLHPNGEDEHVHSLLRLSFLDEYLDDEGFARTLGFAPLDEQATLRRITTATAQIQARSRGLLEPWEPPEPRPVHIYRGTSTPIPRIVPRSGVNDARAMAVRYSHRSIHEFLSRFLDSDFAKPYLVGFDCINAHISNFIALLKYSEFNVVYYKSWGGIGYTFNELWDLLLEVQEAPSPEYYFGSLDVIENTLCRIYAMNFTGFERLRWEVYRSTSLPHQDIPARPETIWNDPMGMKEHNHIRLVTPLYLAAASSFHKYIHWKLETSPDAWRGSDGAELLFVAFIGGIVPPYYGPIGLPSKLHVLCEVLKLGGNPNFTFRNLDGGSVGTQAITVWMCFLHFVFATPPIDIAASEPEVISEWECARWSVIEIMLEFGAVPPFWTTGMEDESSVLVILTVGDNAYSTVYHFHGFDANHQNRERHILFVPSARDLLKGQDFITLRDVVQHHKPHNESAILKLLDDWEEVHGPVGRRPSLSGQDKATTPRIEDLDEEMGRVQEEKHAQEDGCDATATLLAASEEDSACAPEQSAQSEASDTDKGTKASSPSETELGSASNSFRKHFFEVVTHPMLPWLLVGKQYRSTLDSSMR